MDEDVEFVPLGPEDNRGANLEAYDAVEFTQFEPLEVKRDIVDVLEVSPPPDDEGQIVIEFVPEAPHFKEDDGELRPVISEEIRQEVEKEIDKIHLTEREKQMLYAIRTLQFETRYSPTCPELAKLFGMSSTRAKTLVADLVRKGLLEWSKGRNWVHRRILFPKGMKFPWRDGVQFPESVFVPEWLEQRQSS